MTKPPNVHRESARVAARPGSEGPGRAAGAAGTPGAARGARRPLRLPWLVVLSLALLTGQGTLVRGDANYVLTGDTYPGLAQALLLVLGRTVVYAGAPALVGILVFVLFVAPRGRGGIIGTAGFAVLGRAAALLTPVAVAAVAMVPLSVADTSGTTVLDIWQRGAMGEAYAVSEAAKAWSVTAAALFVAAVIVRLSVRWAPLAVAAVLLLIGAVAPEMVGNHGQGSNHDIATNGAIVLVVGFSLWWGLAWAAWLWRTGTLSARAEAVLWRRWALLVLIGAGLTALGAAVTVAVQLGLTPQWWATGYGAWTAGMLGWGAVALAITVVTAGRARGWWGPGPRRAAGVPGCSVAPGGLALGGLLGAAGLALGAMALAARIPAPSVLATPNIAMVTYVGYELPGPFRWQNLVDTWRVDVLWLAAAVIAIWWYLAALRRRAARLFGARAGGAAGGWPWRRTTAWTGGWVLVAYLTSSGIGVWAGGQFSLHMALHIMLNFLVPPLLLLGRPSRLFREAGGVAGAGIGRLVGPLTVPRVAIGIYVLTLFGLYFTPLFDATMRYHWGHQWMNTHFLLTGLLFFLPLLATADDRAVLGVAPVGTWGRIAMTAALMPFHTVYGIIVMSMSTLLAADFFRAILVLPGQPELIADQRLGGVIAWTSGEVPLLGALAVLLWRLFRPEGDVSAGGLAHGLGGTGAATSAAPGARAALGADGLGGAAAGVGAGGIGAGVSGTEGATAGMGAAEGVEGGAGGDAATRTLIGELARQRGRRGGPTGAE